MTEILANNGNNLHQLKADCENCFALCCVALPYAQSADFAKSKDGGIPCFHLQSDYSCKIHQNLRTSGFKGCTVYECYGAGQKVSQQTFHGVSWRNSPDMAEEVFRVFPIMQQLHEMLYYLQEALNLQEASPLHGKLQRIYNKTEMLTDGSPASLLELDVPTHRIIVGNLLSEVSKIVRSKVKDRKNKKFKAMAANDLIGANLKGANLKGVSFKGAYLIAANLRDADLRVCDFLGADLRDTDLSGADLTGSLFLTQAQVNAARGDQLTKLPKSLSPPQHWLV
ncbi:pentapeptide repeat-containing protein [Bacillus rubiinfantis]|uniref:pentapeptide repeat-containing protein n=1 Tax=Bacillus rubiinfantis TaxID=1499680 RepID=UPI0005A85C19|nr:pentapeptide repeat-containing protein [Bacillus rubiinfantis]